MKVTVYFGNVRVIVPCGVGDVLVSELMEMAITRYKKATGKSSLIKIQNLKSSRDDGILYPDDKLNDVADDREQIIADFEEGFPVIPHYNGCGDGTSNSSICTGSPDLFSVEVSSHSSIHYAHSDVEITEDSQLSGATTLQVRRGSEPALNSLCPPSPTGDPSKRWSTAVVMNPGSVHMQISPEECKTDVKENVVTNGDTIKSSSSQNFSRCSGRLSILGNNPDTCKWVEAADRQLMKEYVDIPCQKSSSVSNSADVVSDCSSNSDERECTVILKNESGPLGIHVVPDYDNNGRDTGLVIQGIEAGGRIDRDGRFFVGDRLVEINGQSLRSVSFQAAQEVFKEALKTPQIKIELVRGAVKSNSKTASVPRKPPPPVFPKPMQSPEGMKQKEDAALVEGEERAGGVTTKVATVTPTKKMPATTNHRLGTTNTRRIGKKIPIELKKGASGLGFSITTRDNPAGGSSPIYIKNVLPKGAAIEDGRLKPGDRLMEVNGVEMTGKSQSEAVQLLREVHLGGIVSLVVSRQEVESPQNLEQDTSQEPPTINAEEETGIFPWKHREILTFQIPLTGSGSAGLGVSVKGKSTAASSGSVDLGIFIKSIIPGGAAAKDGRLLPNDQLVNINGISLLSVNNNNAMESLRKAMTQMDGPIPNNIILTIARRINQASEDEFDSSSLPSRTSNYSLQEGVFSNNPGISDEKRAFASSSSNKHSDGHSDSVSTSFGLKDLAAIQKVDPDSLGCNPIIERLTGLTPGGNHKRLPCDPYMLSMSKLGVQSNGACRSDESKPVCSQTSSAGPESVLIEGEYNNLGNGGSVSSIGALSQQGICQGNVPPVSSQLSTEDVNAGFARDGFGRQSMSEKRHAQLDAKSTDTYQRNKKAREERERSRQMFEQEFADELENNHEKKEHLTSSHDDEPRGPSLGLRKSSSLESLQTMLQELNKDDEAIKNASQSSSTRGSSRNRGCNESFRAAVDRSYEAPASATMDTLDEESESGSSVGHILGKAADFNEMVESNITRDPFSDDIINLYCRNSKSSKKRSLLKGLGSVFKFGKSRKGKYDDMTHDGEQLPTHLSPNSSDKEQDRNSEQDHKLAASSPKKVLPVPPRASSSISEPILHHQGRMQNLREQHQRLHQKRQGHYPLEREEELYECAIKAKESQSQPSVDVFHARSHSHDEILNSGSGSKSRLREQPGRYSHYMNYKEIQQHMTQYYHYDQVPQVFYAQKSSNSISKSALHPPDRPNSNYFEYESIQQLHQQAMKQVPESDSSSFPRSSHLNEHAVPHKQAQNSNKHYFTPEFSSNSYERKNIHYYSKSNNGLYSHVVPGSKV